MKLFECISCLSILATALLSGACEPVSVPAWPYTTQTADATTDAGASSDASNQAMSGAGGIQANYAPAPLRCDGGLCDTDNYSLCNVANPPGPNGAGMTALSAGVVVAAVAIARRRNRRRARRAS